MAEAQASKLILFRFVSELNDLDSNLKSAENEIKRLNNCIYNSSDSNLEISQKNHESMQNLGKDKFWKDKTDNYQAFVDGMTDCDYVGNPRTESSAKDELIRKLKDEISLLKGCHRNKIEMQSRNVDDSNAKIEILNDLLAGGTWYDDYKRSIESYQHNLEKLTQENVKLRRKVVELNVEVHQLYSVIEMLESDKNDYLAVKGLERKIEKLQTKLDTEKLAMAVLKNGLLVRNRSTIQRNSSAYRADPLLQSQQRLQLRAENPRATVPLDCRKEKTSTVPLGSRKENTSTVPLGSRKENTSTVPLGSRKENTSTVPLDSRKDNTSTVPLDYRKDNTSTVPLDSRKENTSTVPLGSRKENTSTVSLDSRKENTSTVPLGSRKENTSTVPLGSRKESTSTVSLDSRKDNTSTVRLYSRKENTSVEERYQFPDQYMRNRDFIHMKQDGVSSLCVNNGGRTVESSGDSSKYDTSRKRARDICDNDVSLPKRVRNIEIARNVEMLGDINEYTSNSGVDQIIDLCDSDSRESSENEEEKDFLGWDSEDINIMPMVERQQQLDNTVERHQILGSESYNDDPDQSSMFWQCS